MRWRVIFLFFLLSAFCLFRLEAAGLSFKADPGKVRLIIPANSSQTGLIKVSSQSNEKIKIKVYLEDWVYTKLQDGTKDFSLAKSTPLSCANWITFNPSEFLLAPYGVQALNYVVRVPPDAKGGHYAVMFFEAAFLSESENAESLEGAKPEDIRVGTFLNIRLGTLFYIETKDAVKYLAELTNLSVSKEPKNKRLLVAADLKNTGNVDITAGGSFHIIDREGLVFARGEFNNIYTFPGDTAKLTATWKEPLPKGKYDLILTLDLGKALEELNMGRGSVITKEAEIEVGAEGEAIKVGELK